MAAAYMCVQQAPGRGAIRTWKGRIFFFSGSYATASLSKTIDCTFGFSSPRTRATMSGYLGVLFSAFLPSQPRRHGSRRTQRAAPVIACKHKATLADKSRATFRTRVFPDCRMGFPINFQPLRSHLMVHEPHLLKMCTVFPPSTTCTCARSPSYLYSTVNSVSVNFSSTSPTPVVGCAWTMGGRLARAFK
jgi:hypothetical protein